MARTGFPRMRLARHDDAGIYTVNTKQKRKAKENDEGERQ